MFRTEGWSLDSCAGYAINYPKPMAVLGDTKGIIIRDVMIRAQKGVYIACTLQDSIIGGVQLYDYID